MKPTEQTLSETVALLARTPRVLDALLRDLPDIWTHRNEGDGTWTPFDVVGHLDHGERADWVPRVRNMLEQGESQDVRRVRSRGAGPRERGEVARSTAGRVRRPCGRGTWTRCGR